MMADLNVIHLHRFQLEILGITDGSSPEIFYHIEGLQSRLDGKAYAPAGASRPYYLAKAAQTSDLVLTRPLVEGKTNISFWCEEAVDRQQFELKQGHVLVLNPTGKILAQWVMEDMYPKSIAIAPFDVNMPAGQSIAERITVGYSRLARTK